MTIEKINWRKWYVENIVLMVLPGDDKDEILRELTANRCRTDNGLKPIDDAEFCNRLREATEPLFIRHSYGVTYISDFYITGYKIVRLRKTFQSKIKEEV